jgi:dimethylamine/trimethylamine dehydrogenase
MAREPRHDILFEPVKIGPVTARNRFYQVPHCNGMGRTHPSEMAVMRGHKAEGGWAVVCTEQCDIHPTSDTRREIRLWDDRDIPYLSRMTEQVHAHGSLAAVELVHMGYYGMNLYSREPTMSPSGRPPGTDFPGFARAMDRQDIRDYRRWHRQAALRAKAAGFDIVMCYAGHDISLAMHFLCRRHNQRTDEYGGSLENRVRLLRELLEETKDAVGDTCGVTLRMAVDELMGEQGLVASEEGRDIVEMLAELPDLWDVNCSDWKNDSITARFADEGFQEPFIEFVKGLTSKPVVGVGRYTSPDRMASLVKRGVLDMIGAARPSIADPFLPRKIEEGRPEDIRECIGCNICVGYSNNSVPIRCTQNPTMGEEWRRGWHAENIAPKEGDERVLVVGAGPAGLEAARALGQRGYDVLLAEATAELGGRVSRESRLPGLATWGRVRDYRLTQLNQMANVEIYRESAMTAEDVLQADCSLAVIATGATWRRDGVGRAHYEPIEGLAELPVFSPDDVMSGVEISGPVVVYDDDHYYMGGLMAEVLRARGLDVTLITPAAVVSSWTEFTLEQSRIQKGLLKMGVEIVALHDVVAADAGTIRAQCVYSQREKLIDAASLILVTSLWPNGTLYSDLIGRQDAWADQGVKRVTRIGDCYAPGTIAAAVWSGHKYARSLGVLDTDEVAFDRDVLALPALA